MGVSLTKGQSIDLSKQAPGLSKLHLGLGWDPVKKGGFFGKLLGGGNDSIDLDAACLVFDGGKSLIDTVWFRQLQSKDGAIIHSGDNLTGDGDGDDEVIKIDLGRLPANVQHLVFTVNSYRGQTFNEVDNAFCRLVDESTRQELCRFSLTDKGSHSGVVMAVVSNQGGQWSMKAVGEPTMGKTAQEIAAVAARSI